MAAARRHALPFPAVRSGACLPAPTRENGQRQRKKKRADACCRFKRYPRARTNLILAPPPLFGRYGGTQRSQTVLPHLPRSFSAPKRASAFPPTHFTDLLLRTTPHTFTTPTLRRLQPLRAWRRQARGDGGRCSRTSSLVAHAVPRCGDSAISGCMERRFSCSWTHLYSFLHHFASYRPFLLNMQHSG